MFRRNPEPGLVDEEGLAVEDVEKPRDLEGLAQRVGKPGERLSWPAASFMFLKVVTAMGNFCAEGESMLM